MNATTTSRDEHVKNDIALRNQLISSTLEQSRGMVRNLALKFHFDVEDCMQEAAIEMLEAWDRIPATCTNKKAYLHRCVRNRIIELRKNRLDIISMDMPLAKGPHETLAETFVAPEQTADTTQVDHIIDTIHSALRVCMIEEQEYAVHIYDMNAYTPVAPARRRPGLKASRDFHDNKEMGNIRKSMITALRKHPRVQALIQRETCVL